MSSEPADEHYFTADPQAPFRRERVEVEVWGHRLALDTGSGVFARGRLDRGTAVLLGESGPPGPGRILDLGCGYGVVGLGAAAAVAEAEVWAVDVNQRALLLARENAERLGLAERFRALLPDEVPADLTFDEIWSNPPIRVGKAALHALLLTWLPRLAPGGNATMVVGKNLGADSLARWLEEQGHAVERVATAKGFRVLRISPVRPARDPAG